MNVSNKGQLLQDPFLNLLRKEHVPGSIYLVNGIKLQGHIESFDQYVVLLRNTVTQMVQLYQAEAVIFDQALSPGQQRNLERHLGVAVADRTMLILEIFGERAQSHEGKLQVELARLQYLSTRLVRRWSHLERQRGGIGTRGGPGEAQIELDRRMIGERIKTVKQRLERVKRQRNTQRKSRERNRTFRVSLV